MEYNSNSDQIMDLKKKISELKTIQSQNEELNSELDKILKEKDNYLLILEEKNSQLVKRNLYLEDALNLNVSISDHQTTDIVKMTAKNEELMEIIKIMKVNPIKNLRSRVLTKKF